MNNEPEEPKQEEKPDLLNKEYWARFRCNRCMREFGTSWGEEIVCPHADCQSHDLMMLDDD